MFSGLPPQLASIEKEVRDIFKVLTIGFQKLDKIKDVDKQNMQLEDLTAKMREAKRLIKEFDRELKEEESKIKSESYKMLTEKKQSLIKELNSFVALRKTYTSSIGSKEELHGGSCDGSARDLDAPMASTSSTGRQHMNEADGKATERTSKVVDHTINIGAETATTSKVLPKYFQSTSKGLTEQPGKTNNKLDTTVFSMKNASLKEIGRKVATNRCVLLVLLLITVAIITIVIMKLVHPEDKVPTTVPPSRRRRLLMTASDLQQNILNTL